MEKYRQSTQFEGETYIPVFINLISKYCRALAYVYLYIWFHNILSDKNLGNKVKDKNTKFYFFGIIIFVSSSGKITSICAF